MNAEGPADPADAFGAFFIYAVDRQRRCERKILASLGLKKGARRPTYTAQHLASSSNPPRARPPRKKTVTRRTWGRAVGSYRKLQDTEQRRAASNPDDAMPKTRQPTLPISPRKRPKTKKKTRDRYEPIGPPQRLAICY